MTLAEAEQQLSRLVDQLEAIHSQLLGITQGFPESAGEKDQEDLDEEATAEAEFRRVIECVLADRIRLALQDLRSVLPRTEGEDKEGEGQE